MDAIISNVLVGLVEPTIFCFVDPFPLLRRGLWWLDASFRQIGYRDLGEDFLHRHGQGCILGEATVRCFAFTSYFAFLLFLMEGLSGDSATGSSFLDLLRLFPYSSFSYLL